MKDDIRTRTPMCRRWKDGQFGIESKFEEDTGRKGEVEFTKNSE
jgi:hypothetical protein